VCYGAVGASLTYPSQLLQQEAANAENGLLTTAAPGLSTPIGGDGGGGVAAGAVWLLAALTTAAPRPGQQLQNAANTRLIALVSLAHAAMDALYRALGLLQQQLAQRQARAQASGMQLLNGGVAEARSCEAGCVSAARARVAAIPPATRRLMALLLQDAPQIALTAAALRAQAAPTLVGYASAVWSGVALAVRVVVMFLIARCVPSMVRGVRARVRAIRALCFIVARQHRRLASPLCDL
jgi:hypothetical protein